MRDNLSVRLGFEVVAQRRELRPQLPEVFDGAVVDDRDTPGRVRVGVGLARPPVGRPPGVADAGRAPQWRLIQAELEILELAWGAAALQRTVLQRGDACRVVAAVLEVLQRLDDLLRHRTRAQDPNDAAHAPLSVAAAPWRCTSWPRPWTVSPASVQSRTVFRRRPGPFPAEARPSTSASTPSPKTVVAVREATCRDDGARRSTSLVLVPRSGLAPLHTILNDGWSL